MLYSGASVGNVAQYDFDPRKAEQILEEAGYRRVPDGIRFKTSIMVDRSSFLYAIAAETIRDYLGKVGVNAELKLLDRLSVVDERQGIPLQLSQT